MEGEELADAIFQYGVERQDHKTQLLIIKALTKYIKNQGKTKKLKLVPKANALLSSLLKNVKSLNTKKQQFASLIK
jgi:hypothetical protein